MSKNVLRGRGRVAVSLAVTAALCGSTAALTTGSAQSAPPPGDCATAYPIAELVDGQAVTGLTVDEGTAPEGFTGEFIGTIEDGIAPGLDMVMVDLESPAIDAAGGIWQGMSGSPVYAEDGRLIGAVAYGLTWGSSPIAGVTPFEEMDEYMPAPAPRTVKVSKSDARAIARRSDVSREQASEGFRQLPMPLGISGVSSRRLEQAAGERKWITKGAYVTGASEDAAEAEDMVAGGNLAAAAAYGDITAGGVGTVTSVCDDRIVGFGHPFGFFGTTTLSLHPADALFVQPNTQGPSFKVANIAGPVGTITDDHLSGISGVFDVLPDTTGVTSTVTYGDRSRTGTTNVTIPEANAQMTFYQQVINHDRVLDGILAGSELQSWTVTGDDNGTPFTISHEDRFASDYDIAFESPWDVADVVWMLSSIQGVTIDSVTVDGDVIDDNSTWEVGKLEQRRGGEWVRVGKGNGPAIAKAGKKLKMRVTLKSADATRTLPLSFKIPAKAKEGTRGSLSVFGGAYSWFGEGNSNSVDGIKKMVENMTRNDAVASSLYLFGRRKEFAKNKTSDPTEKVVEGYNQTKVRVR